MIRSADAGASWKALSVPYPNPNTPPDLRGLVLSPSGEALIAVGPPGAILRSNADGSAWDVRHSTPIEAERAFPWVLVDRRRKIIVAVEARGEMRVSRDDGINWQTSVIETPPGAWPFWQGAVLENARASCWWPGEAGKAARSLDARDLAGRRQRAPTRISSEALPTRPTSLLFLMGAEGTLLRSADLGVTWQAVTSGSTQRTAPHDARSAFRRAGVFRHSRHDPAIAGSTD